MIVINKLNGLNIIPKCKGGQSLHSNLIGCCNNSNKDKGTQYWKAWYRNEPTYNEASEKYICNKLNTNKKS